MIISRLVIENYGVFHGRHDIDLRPQNQSDAVRPIILIGGKNGAGKTTLLEAVRLCLYGKNALGRSSRSDYELYISDRIYRSPITGANAVTAKIELTFEYVHAGKASSYHAERAWHRKGNGVSEELIVFKDNKLLNDISREHWNDFLRDLIPPGVADLFFFDGEQIQMLADENTEALALETAVEGLLNLDIVGRLKTDLSLYVRQQAQQENAQLKQLLETLRDELVRAEEMTAEVRQDVAAQRSRLDGIRTKLNTARQALLREGAAFIQQRDQLEARRKELERQIEVERNTIRDLANELLPFTLAPEWNKRLRGRLLSEAALEQARLTRDDRRVQASRLADHLRSGELRVVAPNVQSDDWERIAAQIQALLTPNEEDDGSPLVHPLSNQQRQQMLDWITVVGETLPNKVDEVGRQLEADEDELRSVQRMLQQVPTEEIGQPLIDDFQRLSQEEGVILERIRQLESKLADAETRENDLQQQIRKLWEQLATTNSVDQRIERAATIQLVLDEYLARITALKLEQLEGHIADYFNRLCRKPRLVRNVNIDPDRFRVTLFTENGDILPKSSLSAGERQLYAMSLLWALRAASGRLLPIIIDTPMGRLDSDHRQLLVTRFFPEAAHQTIILSTDTEIDEATYQAMLPIVSHVYSLEYDSASGHTDIRPHYFASEKEQLQ